MKVRLIGGRRILRLARAASTISITCDRVNCFASKCTSTAAVVELVEKRSIPSTPVNSRSIAWQSQSLAKEDRVLKADPAGRIRLDLPAGWRRLGVVADDAEVIGGRLRTHGHPSFQATTSRPASAGGSLA